MGLTTDAEEARNSGIGPDGQQKLYVVLSDEERAKGFVRPVRTKYKHVGCRPKGKLRDLTPQELEQYKQFKYVAFEKYDDLDSSVIGRYWTEEQLKSGCGTVTEMGVALAETYARDPSFYGGTFCCHCHKHFSVGGDGEFVWEPDGERVGT